jgi:hypothetical protein
MEIHSHSYKVIRRKGKRQWEHLPIDQPQGVKRYYPMVSRKIRSNV